MRSEDQIRARSFGEDAAQYDRARPSYPEAMVADLLVGRRPRVLDVGCGTGIAARLFAGRGCDVLGVEPDTRMAHIARLSGVDVETAEFEGWDPRGRTFDLVVSGQAWHWVEPHIGAVKAASVMPPGSRIGLFWNRGRPDPSLGTVFDAIYEELVPDLRTCSIVLGASGDDRFDTAAAALEETGSFEQIVRRSYNWHRTYSRDEWLDLLPTHSDHRTLPSNQLSRILRAVGNEIDQRGGSFGVDYTTVLLTTVRGVSGPQ